MSAPKQRRTLEATNGLVKLLRSYAVYAHGDAMHLSAAVNASDAQFYQDYIHYNVNRVHEYASKIALDALNYMKNAAVDTK